jgi:hypothetical protein
MESREITIDELQIGDEIITLTQQPKYLRVLEVPRKSKVNWSWISNIDRYIAVRCQTSITKTSRQTTKYNYTIRTHTPIIVIDKTYNIISPEEDDDIEKFDLNCKKMWLVKREKI